MIPYHLLRDIQALLYYIQGARKGSVGSIDNVYLPQLKIAQVDRLTVRVTEQLRVSQEKEKA